ncbi:MAG: hypothetical protein EBW13_05810 [Actinobacteria bacterium]|nr:hypothetical protein [Actinomycetota bacterium]
MINTQPLLRRLIAEFVGYSFLHMAVVVSGIMASGGGTRNSYLMERLYAQMPSHLRMTTTNEFGVPAAFKETIKFATLAHAIIIGLSNNDWCSENGE